MKLQIAALESTPPVRIMGPFGCGYTDMATTPPSCRHILRTWQPVMRSQIIVESSEVHNHNVIMLDVLLIRRIYKIALSIISNNNKKINIEYLHCKISRADSSPDGLRKP